MALTVAVAVAVTVAAVFAAVVAVTVVVAFGELAVAEFALAGSAAAAIVAAAAELLVLLHVAEMPLLLPSVVLLPLLLRAAPGRCANCRAAGSRRRPHPTVAAAVLVWPAALLPLLVPPVVGARDAKEMM